MLALLAEICFDGFSITLLYLSESIITKSYKRDACGCVGGAWGCEDADALEWLDGFVFFRGDQVHAAIFFAELIGERLAVQRPIFEKEACRHLARVDVFLEIGRAHV